MRGRLLRPGEDGFSVGAPPNASRWADVQPRAVALCTGPEDVQACVRRLQEQKGGMREFAARSGGHSYAGFSTTTGLLIDVKPMNRVIADPLPGLREALAALFLLAAAVASVAASAEPSSVTWAIYDAPPYMIGSGPDVGDGILDRIRRLLDDRLTDMNAHTLQAPFPRVLASLHDGAEVCFIGGVETPERDAYAVFSLPVAMFYPLRVAVHAPEQKRFEARGPLSLSGLVTDPTLRTSFLKNRSFGPAIDAIMQRSRSGVVYSQFGEAFKMLLADRLDYLVEYSAISHYQAAILGAPDGIVQLPLAETPEPVFSRVMCPKTDWGRGIVAKVDAVLRVERPTPAYQQIVEAWTAEQDLAKMREAYDGAFLHGR